MAAIYEEMGSLLLWIGTVKFNVPRGDAELVLQEALFALVQSVDIIRDYRAWLVAVMCNTCRRYWRTRRYEERRFAPEPSANHVTDGGTLGAKVERKFLVAQALKCLSPKQRKVLKLHYFDGMTAIEVAEELGTTPGYAERLIHKALRRAREYLEWLSEHPRERDEPIDTFRRRGDAKP